MIQAKNENINLEAPVVELLLSAIDADPEQPRKYFEKESLNRLAKSILKHGLQQPILVRPNPGIPQKYIIVLGERRFRASELVGLSTIRCSIEDLTIEEVRDLQLIENLDRDNLSDMELAFAFQKRIDHGQTQQQIADAIGQTRGFVQQRLSLLDLTKDLQDRVLTGNLSFSNARKLLEVKDSNIRIKIASRVTSETTNTEISAMIIQENVTHVTIKPFEGSIKVCELATYRLFATKESISKTELLNAIGQDLILLRGN